MQHHKTMAKDVMDGFKIARLVHNPSKENTSKANNRTGNEKKGRILRKIKEVEDAGINLENLAELPRSPAPRNSKRDRQQASGTSYTSRAVSPRTGHNALEGADSLLQLSQQPIAQLEYRQQDNTVTNPQWSFQTPCHRNSNAAVPNPYPVETDWLQLQYQHQTHAESMAGHHESSSYLPPDLDEFAGLAAYTREPQLQQTMGPDFSAQFTTYDDVFPRSRPASAPALGYMMRDATNHSYDGYGVDNETLNSTGTPQPSKRRCLGNSLSPLAE